MPPSDEKSPIRNGLRDITVQEFCEDPRMVTELVERKLTGLPVNAMQLPAFVNQIQDVSRLLHAVSTRTYGRISMLALLDILQAVDYFLVLRDEKLDSEIGGYADDAKILAAAFLKHKAEIDAFRVWYHSQA